LEQELSVLQTQEPGRAPRALVLSGAGLRPVSLAAAKRLRFIQNLKMNYQRLKEALEFVEHFAVVCELSQARVQAIRQAKDTALEELSIRFDEKLKTYDARIGGPLS
jgi:hypothetical protein